MMKKIVAGRSVILLSLNLFKILSIIGFLIFLTFFVAIQTQDREENDFAFQELIYDIGMSLAQQNEIKDAVTAKIALLNVYEDVTDVMQIVDILLMVDDEIVASNITTVDALIDYEMNCHENLMQAVIDWLSASQSMFIVFKALHPDDNSFAVWCDDMAYFASLGESQEPTDPVYLLLWQAGCKLLETQESLQHLLKEAESI